jgi:protein gp37
MSQNSNIEWCDHTFNPWEGCTKVSAGCAHCYAETRNARFNGGTPTNWGKGAPRRRTSAANWNLPIKWNHQGHLNYEHGDGYRPRVFCASLADWLDDEVPIEWLADLLQLISSTPYLDWLLLTKRPQNFQHRLADALFFGMKQMPLNLSCSIANWINDIPWPNVWIGTTVENQAMADLRIPQLLRIPAKIRFLSCEPLLEHVDLALEADPPRNTGQPRCRVDWVIAGGESGHHARPMHPAWALSLRDQCATAKVPFLFKQMGEFLHVSEVRGTNNAPDATRAPIHHIDGETYYRLGKKQSGRLLNGTLHHQFP